MYTQCPKCETVFHITIEQLRVHDGVVRCGRCDHVFNADQQLFSDIPEAAPDKTPARKKPRLENIAKPKSPKLKTANSPKRPPAARAKVAAVPEPAAEELEAAAAPWVAPVKEKVKPPTEFTSSEDQLDEFPVTPSLPRRRFSFLWIVGAILLILLLAAQTTYFYRDQLAAYPGLRPYLDEMCVRLDCRVQPPYDASRIELVQPTNIAPHPRIASALRLRATLVNRAGDVQAHPYMQVTLTDSAGRVLARRVFSPRQYLEQATTPGTDMPPHLAVSALIDITNPDGKAVGYQIDFLPPPPG
jgi:predicted Zn finger-like uncharacterized protein